MGPPKGSVPYMDERRPGGETFTRLSVCFLAGLYIERNNGLQYNNRQTSKDLLKGSLMQITIKKMETDEEIKGKAFVHFKSWQEAYSGIVKQSYLDERTIDKCEEIALNTIDGTIIAKDDERVIGFIQYGKYNYNNLEDAGEIIALYVLADYYGRGIGYRLMQEAMKQLSSYSKTAVFVIKGNQRAIDFYIRYGFIFDGQEGMSQIGVTVARMVLQR